jgi:uncharacterized membrane protein
VILAGIYMISPALHSGLQIDEARSANIAAMGPGSIINEVAKDNHPPLYYFLLSLWIKVAGNSEAGLRSLSVVFYSLSVLLSFFLSNYIYKNMGTAFFTSCLFAFSCIALRHAANARMYALMPLLAMLSYYFIIKVFIEGKDSILHISALVAVNIAGTFTHYWFLFVIMGQAVFTLIFYFKKFRANAVVYLSSVLPFLAFWGHVFLWQSKNSSMSFISITGREIPETILDFFAPHTGILALLMGVSLLFGVLAPMAVLKSVKPMKENYIPGIKRFFVEKTNIMLLISFLTVLIVPFLVSVFAVPVYIPGRYTLTTFIPLAILAGGFLYAFSNRAVVFSSLIIYTIFFTGPYFINDFTGTLFTEKEATKDVVRDIRKGDIILFLPVRWITAEYYLSSHPGIPNIERFEFPASDYLAHPCWFNPVVLDDNLTGEIQRDMDKIRQDLGNGDSRLIIYWGISDSMNRFLSDIIRKRFRAKYSIFFKDVPVVTYCTAILDKTKNITK